MAVTDCSKEVLWMRHLLEELGWTQETTVINEENNGCIHLAKNPIILSRSKHIDIRHHFIREKIESGEVVSKYISSADNIADILTKGIAKEKFHKHAKEMGLQETFQAVGVLR